MSLNYKITNNEDLTDYGPAVPGNSMQPVHLPDIQRIQAAEKEYQLIAKVGPLMKIMYSRGVSLEEAQTIYQRPMLDELVRLQVTLGYTWDKINLLLNKE